MSIELLKELSETPGIPGREENIRKIVQRELKGAVDKMTVDNLGNLIAYRKGTSKKPKKVMYSSHMDEIGFIVQHIDDKGFLILDPCGGHDPRNTIVQRVKVLGKKELLGVVSWKCKPIHVQSDEDRKKSPSLDKIYVDLGLDVKEVKKLVEIGDPVVIHRDLEQYGNRVTGKALDNRTAVYTLIQALKKSKKNSDDVFAVFSVQEEVGLRGAQVAAHQIAPDIGVALDTTLACDTPGIEPENAITRLGEGVGLTVKDGSLITDRALYEEFQALAKKKKIKHQPNLLTKGGTDGGAIQRAHDGAKTITLSLPTRYIHSSIETIELSDLEAKIALVAEYMKGSV
ncbi:MAG: M42 family metallopeptidase [Candidatus Omnitrophica bacterium]|nr:M42 family metallopeptidase [Candidatus Omnitrophota bacterium]